MQNKELKERFERLYPNCKLACIQLDGFSHGVFYIDENGYRTKEDYSAYLSNSETDGKRWNSDRVKALFLGYANYCYQNNATEYIYMETSDFLAYPRRGE